MCEPGFDGEAYAVPRRLLWGAWWRVEGKGGSAGVDGITVEQFGEALEDNLCVLWDRMSSGSYVPGPVRVVDVPTVNVPGKDGTARLGTPNVVDRVAQTAAVMALEDNVEEVFHDDSYGYRPGRSSLDAVAVCRERFSKRAWVLDVDIRDFFESVPWDLTLEALMRHTEQRWVVVYVGRWLEAPMLKADGSLAPREKGTPQGSPISPLITNLFLHYAFDAWMTREFPTVQFERFADNLVIHCVSERQASDVRRALARRLVEVGLELHPEKTRIVYCKNSKRGGTYEHVSFRFCGYAFPPQKAKNNSQGDTPMGLPPAVSPGKLSEMGRRVASWRLRRRVNRTVDDLAMRRKYRRLECGGPKARAWLRGVRTREPELFEHWRHRALPR
jgi:RNA-directed DNA polymerase